MESAGERSLVYFGPVPMEGAGSPIIILRHLRRLKENGWKVTVISEWGQSGEWCEREGWPVHTLPHRRWWWPPYDSPEGVFGGLCHWLWAGEAHRCLGVRRFHAAMTYLSAFSDLLSQVAVAYGRRYRVPLTVITHDDPSCFQDDPEAGERLKQRYKRILAGSHITWFPSPELAAVYDVEACRQGILPPIPERSRFRAVWRHEFSDRPKVVYAGGLWPAQLPVLRKAAHAIAEAGGRLVLVVRKTDEVEDFLRSEPVDFVNPFESNTEVLDYLANAAAGVLVAYAEDMAAMPWVRSSFPSKLIEYTHLGLPCCVIAPADSSVARWAARVGYGSALTPENMGELADWVSSLKEEVSWKSLAAASRDVAEREFSPDEIQERLETSLV